MLCKGSKVEIVGRTSNFVGREGKIVNINEYEKPFPYTVYIFEKKIISYFSRNELKCIEKENE